MRIQPSLLIAAALLLATAAPSILANMGTDDAPASNEANFQEGSKAIEAQNWAKGIELLTKAVQADPNNADAHNLLGYAYRQTGNFDASFAQYEEALKLNPDHKNVHEYIGKAYLLIGELPKAEQHLAALQKICSPIPCEEYKDLKRAVDAYKKAGKK